MKKIIFIFLIVFLLLVIKITQASAGCNIVWTGDYSGSMPTQETSRTEQARQELFNDLYPASEYHSSPWCYYQYSPDPVYCAPEGCGVDFNVIWTTSYERRVCDSGEWAMIYTAYIPGSECLYPNGCVRESGSWDVVCETTLINLSAFTATPKGWKIILQWSTESEIDNAGFNIYRSESADGEYIKINNSLILAEGSSTQGASYEFTDNDVTNRKTYFYKLEDIDLNGNSTMHGPVSATPRWLLRIFRIFGK